VAIYTPRGLKIRLPTDYAFALMARLYPQVDAFGVLKTVEAIEETPPLLAYCAALACLASGVGFWPAVVAMVGAGAVGIQMNMLGFFRVPGLLRAARVYTYLTGYGVLFIGAMVLGYLNMGWQGPVAYLLGALIGELLEMVTDFRETKRVHGATGVVLTGSERAFVNAYRIHAQALGKPTDMEVAEAELEKAQWMPAYLHLAAEWPQIVSRFTET
jgi:hypothetical protein